MIDAVGKGWEGSRVVGHVDTRAGAATFNDVAGTWGSDVVGAVMVRASNVARGSDELLRIRRKYRSKWASSRERRQRQGKKPEAG